MHLRRSRSCALVRAGSLALLAAVWVVRADAQYTYIGNITAYTQDGSTVTFTCGTQRVKVTVFAPDMVRVRMSDAAGNFAARFGEEPYMIRKYDWPAVPFTFTDQGTYYRILTAALDVRIQKSPFIVSFYDTAGNLISKDHNTNRMGWGTGGVYCGKEMAAGEEFFGLGEQYAPDNNAGTMSYRGYTMEIWNQDSQCEDYRPSYCNVPWIVSNRRYAIFFHSFGRNFWRFGTEGDPNRYAFDSNAGEMDYFFIYGGHMGRRCFKHLLDRYTELTGRPQLPPDWVFGFAVIISNQAIATQGDQWRATGIPGDMIGIDAWWDTAIGSFQFSTGGQAEVNAAHARNFKIWVWQVPVVNPNASTNYNTGATNRYFGTNTSGGVYSVSLWGAASGGYIDCFKPAARNWYKQIMQVRGSNGAILNPNVDCFKTDDGEYVPDATGFLFMDGLYNGREMHNVYGLVYNETVWEEVKNRQGRGFVLHRCSYAGGQRNAVLWAGDNGSTFGDASQWGKAGMQATLRAQLTMGWTGFSYWTTDAGGCDGDRPTDELFQRWVAQWSAFQPFPMLNDYTGGNRAPWFYSAAMQAEMRRYMELRYRMFPYHYTYAYESAVNGTPIMRPMYMEYPDDPKTMHIGGKPPVTIDGQNVLGQYMLGDWLMVCPVTVSGLTSRAVYFPAGTWINFWDESVVVSTGRVQTVAAPVNVIPVFVREGGIVPTISTRTYINQYSKGLITLDVYPSTAQTVFPLYEDSGSSMTYLTGEFATTNITAQRSASAYTVGIGARTGTYPGMPARSWLVNIHGVGSQPGEVRRDAVTLTRYSSAAELYAAAEGWYYDGTRRIVYVKPSQSQPGPFTINAVVGTVQASAVHLTANPTAIPADAASTATLTAAIVDSGGSIVVTATDTVTFTLNSGGGQLLAPTSVPAVNGVASCVYRAGGTPGTVSVSASATGLTPGTTSIILTAPNQSPVVSLTSPVNGSTYTAPASILLTATANDPDGTVIAVRFYRGTTLLNTDNASPWTYLWIGVSSGTYQLYATAADNQGAVSTSTVVTVTVYPANQPPTVTLTSPVNGSTYAAPATIPLAATAFDPDGTISRVEFYAGTTLLFSDTSSPYAYTWNGVGVGTWILTARAYDNVLSSAVSAAVSVSVNPPNAVPPVVTLTAPVNGSTYTAPATVNLAATATDANGSVVRVDFYRGAALIGSDSVSPYAYTWVGVSSGTWQLTAQATDDEGASAVSSPVTIVVFAPAVNDPPTVSIITPSEGSQFWAPLPIEISAFAADSDGNIVSVSFYSGTTLLGVDTAAPYAYSWAVPPPGTYILTARAMDNQGATATSLPITITVNPTWRIAGYIRDQSGAGVPDVLVRLMGDTVWQNPTNAQGYYDFSLLHTGSHTITPEKAGYTFMPTHYTFTPLDRDQLGCDFVAISTGASPLPTEAGEVKVQGGTQGYVDFSVPDARVTVSFRARRNGTVVCFLYTLRGGLVREWRRDVAAGDAGSFVWDGRMSAGELVPAGVYIISVSGAGINARRNIVVVR